MHERMYLYAANLTNLLQAKMCQKVIGAAVVNGLPQNLCQHNETSIECSKEIGSARTNSTTRGTINGS